MRELTSHKVNGCNDGLKVQVLDKPGIGGACHRYHVTTVEYPSPIGGGMSSADLRKAMAMTNAIHDIRFQNGPIKEAGINGITHEALLAIIIDRLEGFQSGPYKCDDNQEALNHLLGAQEVLHRRTKARLARGVEGTHTV